MVIDAHAHFVPASFIDAARSQSQRFPSVNIVEEAGKPVFEFAGKLRTRPMMAPMSDTDKRLAWMQAQRIDRQIAGGWLDMFGYELPPAEGVAWSSLFNQHMLAATQGSPALVGLASVPLQDGAAAAEVLTQAMRDGFAGAMIGTQPLGSGGTLDDPALDPFWQAASDLGAVLMIHPVYACTDPRVKDYEMTNAVARVTDITIAVARLLYAGHTTRFPGAKLIISTGGGALPYMIGRLKRNHAIHPNAYADPEAALRSVYFDTIVFEEQALRYLVDFAGPERVLLGSDYPFPIGDLEPLKLIERSGLDPAAARAICGGNAARLFGLDGVDKKPTAGSKANASVEY
jgi:aminocarboxymuconate-semialdehyde decarboxylase